MWIGDPKPYINDRDMGRYKVEGPSNYYSTGGIYMCGISMPMIHQRHALPDQPRFLVQVCTEPSDPKSENVAYFF